MTGVFYRLIAFSFLICALASAQTTTGAVTGRVTDASSLPLVGATVSLTDVATNIATTSATSDEGEYSFQLVQPGNYRLSAKAKGFKEFERTFELAVAQKARVDVHLVVGELTEMVVVTDQAVELETDSSSLGQVVENQQITDLPLNGRNPYALAVLTPGVTAGGGFGIGLIGGRGAVIAAGANNFQASGGITGGNEILLDGIPVTVCCQGQPALVPSIDVVQEFRVQTNVPPAEFGRTSGGILNIVTKNGGNSLHGTGYEFLQNEKLNANSFFSNAAGIPPLPSRSDLRPPLRYNQFGFSIGGPVVIPKVYNGRNRTFFFGGFERVYLRRSQFSEFSVPTMDMRAGNFSASPSAVYDPSSTAADPNNPGQYIRTAFANNLIPVGRFNASAVDILKLYPQPTTSGIVNNFSSAASQHDDDRQGTVRLDHYFSDRFRSFARFSLDDNDHSQPNFWNSIATPADYVQSLTAKTFVWDNIVTLSPTLIADLRYGFAWQTNYRQPFLAGVNLANYGFSSSYISQLQANYLPDQYVDGFNGPDENANQAWSHYTHTASATISWIHNKHVVKAGWDGRLFRNNDHSVNIPSGEFSYTPTFTNGPNPFAAVADGADSYLSFASYLLGLPSSGDMYYTDASSIQAYYNGLYVQDDFKVTPKLTLNLGFRWDIETGPTERYHRISYLDPTVTNPLATVTGLKLQGAVEFGCVNGNPCQRWQTSSKNPGPRVGFAYQLNSKTVLRGGYGIYYEPTLQRVFGSSEPGFLIENAYVATLDGVTPAANLSNPFPFGLNHLQGSSQGTLTGVGGDVDGIYYNTPMPALQQWNFNIQRQLPSNILVSAAYTGNHGTRLPIDLNMDTLNPVNFGPVGSQSQVAFLLAQVPNPFYGAITNGALSTPTIERQQLLYAYPEYTSFQGDYLPWGQNIYHALQVSVQKPFSHGFSFQLAYTFSKNLGDVNNLTTSFLDTGNPAYQDAYNLRLERSVLASDLTQVFVGNAVWQVPFGRGKRFGSSISRPMDAILGGWQLNGIVTLQSGLPLALSVAGAEPFAGTRPNIVSGVSMTTSGSIEDRLGGSHSAQGYLNPAAFTVPQSFQYGDTSRIMSNLRGPGTHNSDLSLFKDFKLREHLTAQIRGEAFNAFNYVKFSNPGTTVGSSTFGVITGQANPPRQIQLAMKIIF